MKALWFIPIFGVLGLVVLSQSLFVVNEWEQAVVTQFGRPIGQPVTEAGLHFKTPFVQDVHRYERRLLRWDGERHDTITKDRKTIHIDVSARWRITDALRFKEEVTTVERGQQILDGIITSAVMNEVAQYNLYEIVRSTNRIREAEITFRLEGMDEDEAEIEQDEGFLGAETPELDTDAEGNYRAGRPLVADRILRRAQASLADEAIGIELEDILLKAFNYTSQVEQQVFAQMNEELKKIATRFRSQGQQRAEQRRGEMLRELETIRSEAQRDSERIRGSGDAQATEIYAEAYERDPEFYMFLRTLEAQRRAVGENHTLVIGADGPFYRVLQDHRLLDGRR
jgi:modulator of FtsH protease HflC